jgi:hypothetical protein
VDDEALAAVAAEFARCTDTVTGALRCFRRGRGTDPSQLYGDPIESAVAGICQADLVEMGGRYAGMIVAGLQAVALLHYARYHASPLRPAAYLSSAIDLFRIISRAPSIRIPEDIALMLVVLAADDPATVPGLEDPAEAADTATRLFEYATIHRENAALSRAEALVRRVLNTIPTSDPNRVVYMGNLLSILVCRWEWTGTGVTEEILALVDLIENSVHHSDPRWPVLQANAGAACYYVAVRAHSDALLDRSIKLVGCAVAALPDDSPGKAGFLQNLGRAELIRWVWRHEPGTVGNALAHLTRAVTLTVADDPAAADRRAWLAMALLTGDRADPTSAARQLEAADALDGAPSVQVDARLLGEPGCYSDMPRRTTTRRSIGRSLCSPEPRPTRPTPRWRMAATLFPPPSGSAGNGPVTWPTSTKSSPDSPHEPTNRMLRRWC